MPKAKLQKCSLAKEKVKSNPTKFMKSFDPREKGLPSTAVYKKSFMAYKVELASLFLELINHKANITSEESKGIIWLNSLPSDVYSEVSPVTKIISLNINMMKNPKVLRDTLFHEVAHILVWRENKFCNGHQKKFKDCCKELQELFQGDIPKLTSPVLYAELFNTGKLSDINILTDGGKTIKAHRKILMEFPVLFPPILFANVAYGGVFRIPDLAYDVVVEMLHFVYTGRVRNIEQFALPLLKASVSLGVTELRDICKASVGDTITLDNFDEVLVVASELKMHELKAPAFNFIHA
jgi:hypothetical protein